MLKHLRITVTALCLTALVLLLVLWIRSYWWKDAFYSRYSITKWFHIISQQGRLTYCQFKPPNELTRQELISKVSMYDLRSSGLPEIRLGPRFGVYTGQLRSQRMDANWRRLQEQALLLSPGRPPNPSFSGFDFRAFPRGFETQLPYWFMAAATCGLALLAALPWIKWRFGLRTLLIATTLVALVLGALAVST